MALPTESRVRRNQDRMIVAKWDGQKSRARSQIGETKNGQLT